MLGAVGADDVFAEGARHHEVGQAHTELTRPEASIHDVIGVVLRFDHGVEEGLALGEVGGDGPALDADNLDAGLGAVALLKLHDVDHGAGTLPDSARERTARAPDVHELDFGVFADVVEEDGAGAVVAEELELLVLRVGVGFGEDGVEEELALLHAPAGQPRDLHKELRREPLDNRRNARFVALLNQCAGEGAPPNGVVDVVFA